MLRILTSVDDYPRITAFLSERLGSVFFEPYTCLGLEEDGKIVAGMLFNNFTGNDIHVSVAGSRWTRRFLRVLGLYLFHQLRVDRFTGITEQQDVVDIVERLGGRVEGVMRNHFGPGRDGIVLGVLREEYRYHPYGKLPQGS